MAADQSTAAAVPVASQRAVVETMVLPLLRSTGMDVTVQATDNGMTLALRFQQPPDFDPDSCGTDSPEDAARMWALKGAMEQARAL